MYARQKSFPVHTSCVKAPSFVEPSGIFSFESFSGRKTRNERAEKVRSMANGAKAVTTPDTI